MSSIQTILDEREPGQIQVFATGVDASVASLGGISQATLWLPLDLARQIQRDLLGRLDDTPPVHRIQADPTWTREPTCWPWCAGASEPHPPGECYREHSVVPLTLEPHLRGETGADAPTMDLNLEVDGDVPVIGLAVGEDARQHQWLTIAEARQLVASLVDAADMAAADPAPGTAGGAS